MMCAWSWRSGSLSTGLAVALILVVALAISSGWRRWLFIPSASFDGSNVVFRWRRDGRQLMAANSIRGYRFHAVWHLDLIRSNGRVDRLALPSVMMKPSIQAAMAEAGIPEVAEAPSGVAASA